jgi:hypothetical protein
MVCVFKQISRNLHWPYKIKPTTDGCMEGIFVTHDKILTSIRIFCRFLFWTLHLIDVKIFFSNSEVKQEAIHGNESHAL